MSSTVGISGLTLIALTLLTTTPALAQDDPSDAQIAHVAVTANAIDVEMAEVARSRASDERVRAFAGRMITDHTAVNRQAAELAGRLGVEPEDNALSRTLREGAEAAKKALREAAPSEFDVAYMEREVAYHRAVLEALDDALIPSTENGDLKALLRQARGAVAAHLAHAEDLRAALGSEP